MQMIKIKKINFFVQKKQFLSYNKDIFYMFTCFIILIEGFYTIYIIENSNLKILHIHYSFFICLTDPY